MKMRPDILTHCGHYFDFITPEKSNIDIVDIATGLSNICRFNGQCHQFYSVAQHSVYVSYFVPPELALAGLLHDAAEAYVGDMTAPLKGLLPEYKVIEKRVHTAIFKAFDLDPVMDERIKKVDIRMLATEQKQLMAPHDDEWALIAGIEPFSINIEPLHPSYAFQQFMQRFFELGEL